MSYRHSLLLRGLIRVVLHPIQPPLFHLSDVLELAFVLYSFLFSLFQHYCFLISTMVRLRTLTLLCSNVVAVAVAATCASNTLETDYPAPVAANGWTYRLIAKDLSRPRGILFDNEGGLIIVDSGAGLVHLKIKDDGGSCLSVEEKTTLLETDDVSGWILLA